jgi:hypothetical protein
MELFLEAAVEGEEILIVVELREVQVVLVS